MYNYDTYFYLIVKSEIINEFQQYFSKNFKNKITFNEIIDRIDLKMVNLSYLPDKLSKANLRVLDFDIETTKARFKFPDSRIDSVMLIHLL